jgi:processive 1,2-diacylglycerol beta-glucosyltransferase
MNEKKKILILYNSIGLGHKSIAENIGYYLSEGGYEVRLSDILEVQGNWLSSAGAWLYHIFITRLPFVWSFLYFSKRFTGFLISFRTMVGGKNYHKVKEVIDAFQPDVVISTHTVSSGIVAFLKQKKMFNGMFGIAFSDFHLHRYWLYDEADFYLANIEEQQKQMEILGIPASKIFVCGITLPPKPKVDIQQVREKLGIYNDERVVLVSSGSQGTGINQGLLISLSEQPKVKVVVVCGKNKKLFGVLTKLFPNHGVIILGFYKPMDELYAIADIYITKPGGLSTAEALRWSLPMLISHVLPGQEELNFEYLQDKGLVMPEPIILESEVVEELEEHRFRDHLLHNVVKDALFPETNVLLGALESVTQDK